MRFLTLFLFFSFISLDACPFANGSYKKCPPPKRAAFSPSEKRSIYKEELEDKVLHTYALDYEKHGYDLKSDLNFFSPHQEELAKELFSSLEILETSKTRKVKRGYSKYLFHLRKALALSMQRDDPDTIKRLQVLTKVHFEIDLKETLDEMRFFEEAISSYPAPQKNSEVSIKDLNEFFAEKLNLGVLEKGLRNTKRRLAKALLKDWDSALLSMRFELGHLKGGSKTVRALRMGCPIISKYLAMHIDPLFIGYLDHLQEKGEKHLYINLMNQNKRGWEQKASKKLELLAKSETYESTLYYMSLPYNGSFYRQDNLGLVYVDAFLSEFKQALLKGEKGFHLPETLIQNLSFQKDLEALFHEIHQEAFASKPTLMQRERWQFIDLAYAKISARVMELLEVDSVNWTCRHGIDRAMSAFTVFEGMHQNKQDYSLKHSIFFAYLPSFLFYSRAPIAYHNMRTWAALEKLEKIEDPSSSWVSEIHFSSI